MAQSTTKSSRKPASRKTPAKSPATSPAKSSAKAALPKTAPTQSSLPKTKLTTSRNKGAAGSSGATAPKSVVVSERSPVTDAVVLKKPELIDMIVERSGVKKRDVKPALDAALQILGEALLEGREMNLQPLGKVKLNRLKELSNARVINCKIRQPIKAQEEGKDPLAEDDE